MYKNSSSSLSTLNGLKSIPIEYFEKYGHKVKESYSPRIDYLKVINELYFNKEVAYEK